MVRTLFSLAAALRITYPAWPGCACPSTSSPGATWIWQQASGLTTGPSAKARRATMRSRQSPLTAAAIRAPSRVPPSPSTRWHPPAPSPAARIRTSPPPSPGGGARAPPPPSQPGDPFTLTGIADEGGHLPLPSAPADLRTGMDVFADSTVWLGLASISENDGGVLATWIGDYNADRMADLAVGLPGPVGDAGQVAVIYGQAGGWSNPPDLEMLAASPMRYVGLEGMR